MENQEGNTMGTFPTIALLTYHSAYNFGSALQAYATQQALKMMGYNADIINYRMAEQNFYYNHTLTLKYGVRAGVNDLSMLPVYNKRKERARRFENFFQHYLSLTQEAQEPEEVEALWKKYDLVISGSDQIWNKNSCELRCNEWRYMDPYLLKDYPGRKISYASSVNTMSDEDLERIMPELKSFDALAFRESISSKRIGSILLRQIETVLDPTFLLTKLEWVRRFGLKTGNHHDPYILCYSLGGIKADWTLLKNVRLIAKKRGCKVIMVTPFTYIPVADRNIEYHHEYGPLEFLECVYNADMVITNSYHGMAMSINLEKDFYSTCKLGSGDIRKKDILDRIGLAGRIVYNVDELSQMQLKPIDYKPVYRELNSLRDASLNYLRNNISAVQN